MTLLGYLYDNNYIKYDSVGWKIWNWKVRQKWNQWSLIPYHVVMGIKYNYKWNDILLFCRNIVRWTR